VPEIRHTEFVLLTIDWFRFLALAGTRKVLNEAWDKIERK